MSTNEKLPYMKFVTNKMGRLKEDGCGICIYCSEDIKFLDIKKWCYEKDGGKTAVCPECFVDAIVPESFLPKENKEKTISYWRKLGFEI